MNGHSTAKSSNGLSNGTNGTNGANGTHGAHESHDHADPLQLFILSAGSEKSLKLYTQKFSDWITQRKPDAAQLENIAYTLAARRSLFPWRRTVVASDFEGLVEGLRNARISKTTPLNRLAFIFTGQGAQRAGMGRELMKMPAFERSILKSEKILSGLGCKWLLSEEIFADEKSSRLGEAELAQPGTTGLQIALVDLLSELGVKPSSVVGHSSGEIAAAYASGALAHEAAIEA